MVEYDLLQRRPLQSFGENILLFKARYGVDNGVGGIPNDDAVDEWIAPSESGWSIAELMDGNAATQQKVDQIKAIRIGVILRTPQAQAVDAKSTQLVLFQDLQTSRQVTVKLSSGEQRYGYQVFDWLIPLRNMKSTQNNLQVPPCDCARIPSSSHIRPADGGRYWPWCWWSSS